MTSEEQELKELRSISMRELAIIVTLLLNFGALVWGAATMHSAINELRTTVAEINYSILSLGKEVHDMNLNHSQLLTALEEHNRLEGATK